MAINKFSIEIKWGGTFDGEQSEPVSYQFDTQAEIRAFNEGIEAGNGWLDYEVLYTDEELENQ